MNILDLDRKQIEEMVKSGLMRPENLKHYDICKAMQEGKTQNAVAEMFDVSDKRTVRYIKSKKCANC